MLHLDGFDLRPAPLLDRKRVLAGLLEGIKPPIVYSEHMEVDGSAMFEHACKLHLEGVVSKLRDAPYRSGRGETWVKVKCYQREEFAIVGFEPEGKHQIASLHLARGAWQGSVGLCRQGGGFSTSVSVELRKRLDALVVERPVVPLANRQRSTVAVKPSLIANVEYRSITADGRCDPRRARAEEPDT